MLPGSSRNRKKLEIKEHEIELKKKSFDRASIAKKKKRQRD